MFGSRYFDRDVPHGSVPKLLQYVRRELRDLLACAKPHHELEKVFADYPEHSTPLHILAPKGCESDRYEHKLYYNSHRFRCPELFEQFEYNQQTGIFDTFRNSLLKASERRGVLRIEGDQATVVFGIRRPAKFSEVDAALGLHVALLERERWYASTPKLNFYPNAISPHLTKSDRAESTSPLGWASKRLSIALGYAFEMIGRDLPAPSVEETFLKVAPIAGNLAPAAHREPRTYTLTEHTKRLLEHLSTDGSPIAPELFVLIAENADNLSTNDIESKSFQKFVANFSKYLTSGLNVDRITEALVVAKDAGYTTNQALPHILTVIENTHGRTTKPWWFKEDFSIFGAEKLSAVTPNDVARISESAGCAYEYCREVFRKKGLSLTKVSRLRRITAIRTCVFIGKRYAIGNVDRGVRVLDYVDTIMSEHPGESPRAALKIFFTLADREKPTSVALACYEGDKATLHIPGFFASMNTHLSEDVPEHRALEIPAGSAVPSHFKILAKELERPLVERAKLLPGVDAPRGLPAPLLVQYHGPERKLLSLDIRNSSQVCNFERPVSDFLVFQEQLSRELGDYEDKDHIASVYFAYCAPKFPNPLRPPPGFLTVLRDFANLPNPGWRFAGLDAPEDRCYTHEENKDKIIRKYMILSHLLDTWLLGMTTWNDIEKTLKWMVSPLPDSEVRRIQLNQSWGHREMTLKYIDRECGYLNGYYQKESRKLAKIQRTVDLRKAFGDEPDNCLLRELEFAKENLQRIFAGKHPRENWWDREEDAESANHLVKTIGDPFPSEDERYNYDSTIREATTNARTNRMRRVVSILEGTSERRVLFERGLIEEAKVKTPIREQLLAAIACERVDAPEFLPAIIPSAHDRNNFAGMLDLLIRHQMLNLSAVNSSYGDKEGTQRTTIEELHRIGSAVQRLVDLSQNSHRENVYAFPTSRRNGATAATSSLFETLEKLRTSALVDFSSCTLNRDLFWRFRYSGVRAVIQQLDSEVLPSLIPTGASHNLLSERNAEKAVLGATRGVLTAAFASQALQSFDAATDWSTFKDPQATDSSPINGVALMDGFEGWQEKVTNDFKQNIPAILDVIRKARRDKFLLGPIGGKIHVIHPINQERLEEVKNNLGLSSTGFALIHAGHSILLPPMPTPEELNYLIAFLGSEGILDKRLPEIQYACSGRLPNKLCGILGSTILLGTNVGIRYNAESFSTNRNGETGMRIMVYDAGGPRSTYPFVTELAGRTDMLGRQDHTDAEIYQLVHTVLAHALTNGALKQIGLQYVRKHLEALRKHDLHSILSAGWVYTPHTGQPCDSKLHYEQAIKPCTDAWFKANELAKDSGKAEGIIADVHNNLDWLKAQVRIVQERALLSPLYATERRILLGSE